MIDYQGQQLGNYRLIRLLGTGGMASVYLAEHVHLGTQAAIKLLHTYLAGKDTDAFRKEARTIARLVHPHIVRVFDFGIEGETPFLVMDYAPNGTVRQRHPKGMVLPMPMILNYVKQTAAALQYAHDEHLVHRDVKPENILLGKHNDILLSDFGLAIISSGSHAQQVQETAGTTAYMAPEQLQGHPCPTSDQYALGIMVYEWLCGEHPFHGSFPEIASQHLFVAPPSLCEKVPSLAPVVEHVVLKALAKDPGDRFARVQAFALALEEASREESSGRTRVELSTDHPTTDRFTNNLPLQLTTLLGREQEVASACVLLRRPDVRLVTLTGTGGIGKTRLALQLATELAGDFADGICFVPLAPISDPDLVVPTIAQVLRLQERADQPVLSILKAHLQEKRLLLLLDNFEQILSAAPRLAELLVVCPQLKILVTSRAALHVQGEHEFAVPPLAVPDLAHLSESEVLTQYPAVALFLQRAQAIKRDFELTQANTRAIAEICARLDGLPLAIELAAARIKLLPPQAILRRLEHPLHVLTGSAQTMPARQQTLRNTISWSYHLLDAQERRLFQQLSIFVGGCTLEAAEFVCAALGAAEGTVLDGIASLIDKSLLQQREQENEEPRLLMLETIREYGLEVLGTSGGMEVTQRAHVDYYLKLAEEANREIRGPQQISWWERLERELDNLRAALRWLLEQTEAREDQRSREMALRLATALSPIWSASARQGRVREGLQWLKRALRSSEGITAEVRAKALQAASRMAYDNNDFEQGEALCEESLVLFRELGDTRWIALSLISQGAAALEKPDVAKARPLLEEAVALLRKLNNKEDMAIALSNLGQLLADQGEYTRAYSLFEESLAMRRELGDKFRIAVSLLQLAELLFHAQGDQARVRALLEESLTLAREVHHPVSAHVCYLLGELALSQGDTNTAQTWAQESLTLFREIEMDDSIAWSLSLLGRVATVQGDYGRARALCLESLTFTFRSYIKRALPFQLERLADVVTNQGEPRWAAQLLGKASSLREAMGLPIPPVWRANYERAVATTRTHLGGQSFATAWAEGSTMTPEQALTAKGQVTILASTPTEPSSASPTKSPASSLAGLTAREVEVLRLVAQGLTDGQVAEHLVISPRTVNTHLKSIYGKIQVSSRSAATRYALEHQLV